MATTITIDSKHNVSSLAFPANKLILLLTFLLFPPSYLSLFSAADVVFRWHARDYQVGWPRRYVQKISSRLEITGASTMEEQMKLKG